MTSLGDWHTLEQEFPGLQATPWRLKSPCCGKHNCIAFAAGDSQRWWWPTPGSHWPDDAPRELTIEAFEAAFATLGFGRCDSGELEPGYDKVALYASPDGEPIHMARQRGKRWHSKLGTGWNILHDLKAVEGDWYGEATCFFRRKAKAKTKKKRKKR